MRAGGHGPFFTPIETGLSAATWRSLAGQSPRSTAAGRSAAARTGAGSGSCRTLTSAATESTQIARSKTLPNTTLAGRALSSWGPGDFFTTSSLVSAPGRYAPPPIAGVIGITCARLVTARRHDFACAQHRALVADRRDARPIMRCLSRCRSLPTPARMSQKNVQALGARGPEPKAFRAWVKIRT
jgi:hypothetical protein